MPSGKQWLDSLMVITFAWRGGHPEKTLIHLFEEASYHYAEANIKSMEAPPSEVGIQSHLTGLAVN